MYGAEVWLALYASALFVWNVGSPDHRHYRILMGGFQYGHLGRFDSFVMPVSCQVIFLRLFDQATWSLFFLSLQDMTRYVIIDVETAGR